MNRFFKSFFVIFSLYSTSVCASIITMSADGIGRYYNGERQDTYIDIGYSIELIIDSSIQDANYFEVREDDGTLLDAAYSYSRSLQQVQLRTQYFHKTFVLDEGTIYFGRSYTVPYTVLTFSGFTVGSDVFTFYLEMLQFSELSTDSWSLDDVDVYQDAWDIDSRMISVGCQPDLANPVDCNTSFWDDQSKGDSPTFALRSLDTASIVVAKVNEPPTLIFLFGLLIVFARVTKKFRS